jgi:hypothetical protein
MAFTAKNAYKFFDSLANSATGKPLVNYFVQPFLTGTLTPALKWLDELAEYGAGQDTADTVTSDTGYFEFYVKPEFYDIRFYARYSDYQNDVNPVVRLTNILVDGVADAGTITETIVISTGQTVFTGLPIFIQNSGSLTIYVNGVYQESTSYVETSNQSVTFDTEIPAGYEVVFKIGKFSDVNGTAITNYPTIINQTCTSADVNYTIVSDSVFTQIRKIDATGYKVIISPIAGTQFADGSTTYQLTVQNEFVTFMRVGNYMYTV